MKFSSSNPKKVFIITMFFCLVGSIANASGGGGHGASAGYVPFPTIGYQLINVLILLGGLVYLTRDKVVSFFVERHASYQESYKKTKTAREEAEKNLEDVKVRLTELQKNKGDSILSAQSESEQEKQQIIREAHEKAKKIVSEAIITIEVELAKAKANIRTQMINESMEKAKDLLVKDIGAQDHLKLQVGFSAHIEEIRNENARSL